jgi:hemerythrin superfamily protein
MEVVMDATEMLMQDHDRVRTLFQQFKGGGGIGGLVKRMTGNVTARERKVAVEKICHALEVHSRIEEEVFYPAVTELGDTELTRLVRESLREHAAVKNQVKALEAMRTDGHEIDGLVSGLEEAVEHHASDEERQMFPRLRDLMPEAERDALGRRLRALERSGAAGEPRAARKANGGRAQASPSRVGRTPARRRKSAAPAKARKRTKRARGSGR